MQFIFLCFTKRLLTLLHVARMENGNVLARLSENFCFTHRMHRCCTVTFSLANRLPIYLKPALGVCQPLLNRLPIITPWLLFYHEKMLCCFATRWCVVCIYIENRKLSFENTFTFFVYMAHAQAKLEKFQTKTTTTTTTTNAAHLHHNTSHRESIMLLSTTLCKLFLRSPYYCKLGVLCI